MINDTAAALRDRITVNPAVMLGKLTIRGTRLTVEHVLKAMAAGLTFKDLKADYPFLQQEDLQACLWYASTLVEEEKVFPITT